MNNFTFELAKVSGSPLYKQLYDYISSEIKNGRLRKNEKLPSKKAIASHLHISQNTVETAYSMLVQEGYIYSKPRSGYYVCGVAGLILPPSITYESSPQKAEPRFRYDFATNAVDMESFPFKTWAKLNREVVYRSPELLLTGDGRGDSAIRESLAKYLHEFRGVNCSANQIVIGAGIEYLLTLICALLASDVSFAVENPGYPKSATVIKNSGREIKYISLDREGLNPEMLRESGAKAAYITPPHQFPTGIVMPIGRRAEILRWAGEETGRYIIEDDYNSEFNFLGKPIPSVQGIDSLGRVIYMSTFSRILAPSIRIAYMVLPPELLERFSAKFGRYSSTVSRFDQHTLCRFIDGGHLSRHLNRVKNIYRKRRDALSSALRSLPCAGSLKISGENAGLHLIVEMPAELAERTYENAKRENIRVSRLRDFCHDSSCANALLLGYASMRPEEMENAARLLFS